MFHRVEHGCMGLCHPALLHDGICVESRGTMEHREMVAGVVRLDDGVAVSARTVSQFPCIQDGLGTAGLVSGM